MTDKAKDIALTRFPFTDLETARKRPVLIISPNDCQVRNADVVGLLLITVRQSDLLL